MSTRSIPKTYPELITLAGIALGAAEAHSEEIGLMQNTPERIRADLERLAGQFAEDAPSSTQQVLAEARVSLHTVRVSRREAMADGRAFCAAAVDLLKLSLGRRWNPRWIAAGFSRGSLALPHNPLLLLTELRNYFHTHPEQESVQFSINSERADALAAALVSTTQQVQAERGKRSDARKQRDAAFQRLAARLRGLRNELEQLLTRDDPRWRLFGFSRPIDRRQPAPIAGATVEPSLPGAMEVKWEPAARAENYRVSWSVENSSESAIELGLFSDPRARLAGLPAGATVLVAITARNVAGESAAFTVRGIVP